MPHVNEKKLTWKKFIEMVEASGIKDDDEIDSIDIMWGGEELFNCEKNEDDSWKIAL